MKDRISLSTIFLLLVIAFGCIAMTDCGQVVHADNADRELALAVARTTMNEASFTAAPADLYMIWQITEGHGDTTRERLSWLRAHSSCVNTDRALSDEEQRTNCRWTRYLRWDGGAPEPGWSRAYPHLRWASWRDDFWRRMPRLALQLVQGREYERPCEELPDTWGGRMDHTRALERGLVPVVCVGTLNTGYKFPRAGSS